MTEEVSWLERYLEIFTNLEDSRVGSRLDSNASKGSVEEVWVVVDRLLEALGTKFGQDAEVVVCLGVWDIGLFVIQSLELRDLQVIVVAVLVKVAPGGRDIGLVFVVGVAYALRRWRATNGPRSGQVRTCVGIDDGRVPSRDVSLDSRRQKF